MPSGLVVTAETRRASTRTKRKLSKCWLLGWPTFSGKKKRPSERKNGAGWFEAETAQFGLTTSPQDRVTDHRIGLTTHNLPGVLQGDMKQIIEALQTHYQTELLRGLESDA